MPRVARFHAFGGPETLRIDEVPSRTPGVGEARLRVEAAGVTRDQLTFMAGRHPSGHGSIDLTLPSRLGYEVAGVVDAVGDDVDGTWIGKRVAPIGPFDQQRYGVIGEEALVPVSALREYPPNLTAVQAAAFWVPYLTAYGGLVWIAGVGPGDVVSIPGAASAVGSAAIQIARDAGATSIAVTRSALKRQALTDAGADHVIVTAEEDYATRVSDLTAGKGARVTFDPVGGRFMEHLVSAAALGGVLIEYGVLSAEPAPFPLAAIGKGLNMRGYTVSEVIRDPAVLDVATRYIHSRLASGRFVPAVARTFPLDHIADAYRCVESNQDIGRVVIENN